MICDKNGGLCMAGIYGGLDSGVSENTKNIFLESAYFDPVSIRKSSKSHGLNTDSSFRFERGVDPNMTVIALKKAALLLSEYADAKVKGEILDIYPNPIENFKIVLRYHKLDQLLGERIHREQIKSILESLDIEINSESNETLEVSVPPFRVDVQREVDLIEEILRIYGYNQIKTPQKVAFSAVRNNEKNRHKFENAAANVLAANGFYEAMNNSLTKFENQQTFDLEENKSVKMLNPLSGDLAVMRQALLPGLLENSAYNLNRRIADIKLFEFGKIYSKSAKNYAENNRLSVLISGNKTAENWTNPVQKTNFFTLKGIVYQIFEKLNIQDITEKPFNSSVYSDAVSFDLNGKNLAKAGIVAKNILKKSDVSQDVFYADLDWDLLVETALEQNLKYREVSKFPAVKRDLALLIDKNILYFDLFESTQKLNLNLLKSVQLFDVYEGDKLPVGKKSYAMSFVLQDEEKTLSDSEIEKTMNELIRNFQKNFKAELRN
jgi:phenylalanyl-tRNA synthetase beta chain